jgi:hypothetical protein
MLNHFITEQDFYKRRSRYSFTLVVVYDLTEDGSRLDEKIQYCMLSNQAVTGFLTATPAAISTISAYNTIGGLIQLIVDQTI